MAYLVVASGLREICGEAHIMRTSTDSLKHTYLNAMVSHVGVVLRAHVLPLVQACHFLMLVGLIHDIPGLQ